MDTSYFGYSVLLEERQNLIKLIKTNFNLGTTKNNLVISDSDKLFIYNTPNSKNKFIILSKEVGNKQFIRYIFDYYTGIIIKTFFDNVIFQDINNLRFSRKTGNITLTIENQKLINYKVKNKLQPIKPLELVVKDRNTNFGTFDLETFKDIDNLAKVYALGFYTKLDKSPNLFYLTDYPHYNSDQLILKCIDEMLVNKYNNYIFYVHNLGHYDIVFLYNVILKYNLRKGYDYYILKTIMRDNTIIKLDIRKKIISNTQENKHRYIKISFVDSLNILNSSLEKLTREYNIYHKKSVFPHTFVNKNTLNFKGNKPNIDYFPKISLNEYNTIPEINWDLRSECLKYLNLDLKSLFEVINEFSRLIYIHFNVQMTDSLTITRLALNIFKSKYYKEHSIPAINKLFLFNFIKEGYYGGVTDVYRPHGRNLVYIDVNSLYPYAALNSLPGTECYFLESFQEKGLDLDKLFGFFYAKVKTNNLYIGLLPVHKDGRLIQPNGEFEGIWSSEELKFAKSKGYEIKVIKG